MQRYTVPCGQKEVTFSLPEKIETLIIQPKELPPLAHPREAIEQAILNPIGRGRIRESVGPDSRVAIIVTDTTRKLPEDIIVPLLLDELEGAGVDPAQITVVNALGKHDPNTREELEEMLGREVLQRVRVINTNPDDPQKVRYLGTSKNGIPIEANDVVCDAHIRIATGVIEPHLFAGYSGGVKTLSVGVAGLKTLSATHNAKMLDDPKTRLGVIENNIFRQFLTEAALAIGLDFIVNVVQNGNKEVLGVFAGDPVAAFEEGVAKARGIFEVPVDSQYDIVISAPGYPKSTDLYQATRAWNSVVFGPKPVVKKGGTIIIPAPCEKGFGHEGFHRILAKARDPEQVIEHSRRCGFEVGEHKAFIAAKVLKHARVMITDCLIPAAKLGEMFLEPVASLEEAVQLALSRENKPKVLIFPYGLLTLPVLSS